MMDLDILHHLNFMKWLKIQIYLLYFTGSSAAMVLTNKEDIGFIVFHKDGFQVPVPSQCQEMIKKADTYGSDHGTVAVLLPGFAINW